MRFAWNFCLSLLLIFPLTPQAFDFVLPADTPVEERAELIQRLSGADAPVKVLANPHTPEAQRFVQTRDGRMVIHDRQSLAKQHPGVFDKNGDMPVHDIVSYPGGPEFHITYEDVVNENGRGFDDEINAENRQSKVRWAAREISRNLVGQDQVRPVTVLVERFAAYQSLVGGQPSFSCEQGGAPFQGGAWHAIQTGEKPAGNVPDMTIRVRQQTWPGDCDRTGFCVAEDHPEAYDLKSLLLGRFATNLGIHGAGTMAREGVDEDGDWRTQLCWPFRLGDPPKMVSEYLMHVRDADGNPIFAENGDYIGPDADPYDDTNGWHLVLDGKRILVDSIVPTANRWHPDREEEVGQRLRMLFVSGGPRVRELDPEDRVVLRDILGYTVSGDTQIREGCLFCDDFEAVSEPVGLTGAFFDADAPGDGFNLIVTEDERLAAFWYGFDASGNRLWLVSETIALDDLHYGDTVTAPMLASSTGTFANPGSDLSQWGVARFTIGSCNTIRAVLDGQDGRKEQMLSRLTTSAGGDCDALDASDQGAGFVGAFFDATKPGDGYNLVVTQDGQVVVFWYGFDASGNRLWLISDTGSLDKADQPAFDLPLFSAEAGTFASPEVGLEARGDIQVAFDACDRARIRIGVDGQSKVQDVIRLTASPFC